MRYLLHSSDALFGPDTGCDAFEQRLLRFSGPSDESGDGESDEVLYVISGGGAISLGGGRSEVAAGSAAYVARGTPWRVEEAGELVVLSVLVRDPLPADGRTHTVLDAAATENATAGRQFQLLATPAVGCASVTQFIGIIPVGRAPDHFHTYEEVVYVLEGTGALHIDGESAEMRAGTCVHLPARLVHCLENVGPGEMRVLGVFRPAGSPAEAYYPDGTLAQY
ncbi:MAG TPA: cupin domain-containing protein [Gaiellaceae bacterium]|nr:cupin domain-containing protein [Gaiellaceae bacterium]